MPPKKDVQKNDRPEPEVSEPKDEGFFDKHPVSGLDTGFVIPPDAPQPNFTLVPPSSIHLTDHQRSYIADIFRNDHLLEVVVLEDGTYHSVADLTDNQKALLDRLIQACLVQNDR